MVKERILTAKKTPHRYFTKLRVLVADTNSNAIKALFIHQLMH